jgi:hypothetical protein
MMVRRSDHLVVEAIIVLACVFALLAVQQPGPIRLMLFLVVGVGLLCTGIGLYLFSTIRIFLRRRGVTQVRFGPGETIFREGDFADGTYRILEGRVEVVRLRPDGEPSVLATLADGAFFGDVTLQTESRRSATARALSHVRAIRIGGSDLASLSAFPDFRRWIEESNGARS